MYKNRKRPCDACKIPLSSMQICNVIVLAIVKSPLSVQPFLCSSPPLFLSVSLMWSLVWTLKNSFRRKNANTPSPHCKGVCQVVGGLMFLVYDCIDLNGDSCFQISDK